MFSGELVIEDSSSLPHPCFAMSCSAPTNARVVRTREAAKVVIIQALQYAVVVLGPVEKGESEKQRDGTCCW